MASKVMAHLKYLCETVGSRPMGTAANNRAADYIRSAMESYGLQVEEQAFETPAWQLECVSLRQGDTVFDATPNPFSPPVSTSGSIEPICTIAALRASALTGRIALLFGDIVREKRTPRAFTIYQPEENLEILQLLEEKQPAAVIMVSRSIHSRLPLMNDWTVPIPSLTVTPEAGLQLLKGNLPVHIDLGCSTVHTQSVNIFGRRLNPSGLKRLALCAHFDTQYGSPGASDNGTGVAVLLAVAEQLAKTKLKTTVEFMALNGEEYAALGDQAYLASQPDVQNIKALINIDGVGPALASNTLTAMGTSETVTRRLQDILHAYPNVVWTQPWYASNHTTFLGQGVPVIPMHSIGVENVMDSPLDELRWISEEKLEEAVRLVMDIVLALDELPYSCHD